MDIKTDKVSANKQTLILVFGLLLLSMLIIGGTYAYLTWGIDVVNNVISSSTTCFDIVYDADNDNTPITGTLVPSSGPGGGLSGKISMGINESCQQIDGYGIFYLDILTSTAKLLQTVNAHCENSQTLRTLTKYTDQESCESQTNGVWVVDGSALKYAIYTTNDTSSTVPVQVGYLNSIGKKIIYENFPITNTTVDYYIYVWLDGNMVDNSYASQSFGADLSASASQIEEDMPTIDNSYAVYSETDNSLRFYKTTNVVSNTDDSVVASPMGYKLLDDESTSSGDIYTELETAIYSSASQVPWNEYRDSIKSVIFEDSISPISLQYWFKNMSNVTYMDLSKLDVSKITSMDGAFFGTASNATTFTIVGLNNWDVSNVRNMQNMFLGTAGSATTFNIGSLSEWDVSNVTTMYQMFLGTAYKASEFNLDLSNWDVSSVLNMQQMFQSTGNNATTFNLGDLSGWNTSSVTTMKQMFQAPGAKASNWSLDLSGWDVSKVTDYAGFNYFVESKVTAPTWVN